MRLAQVAQSSTNKPLLLACTTTEKRAVPECPLIETFTILITSFLFIEFHYSSKRTEVHTVEASYDQRSAPAPASRHIRDHLSPHPSLASGS